MTSKPKNKVWLYDGSLIISFEYSPAFLNMIRSIDGRSFDKANRRWQVPLNSVIQCVEILEKHKFTISPEVYASYREAFEQRQLIKDLKKGNTPYGGSLPLYDFQKTGTAFIKTLPASLLADAPGLGKTIQTAAAFEHLGMGQILVLVPASLKFNWQEELAKWVPDDTCLVIHGNKKERQVQWRAANSGKFKWVIANYELLLFDFELMDRRWGAIVCDEADRISNPRAKRTLALKQLKTKKRIALTGTPVSNTPEDLWSIADWLYPGMLGNFYQFRAQYCNMHHQWKGRVIGYRNLTQLRERIEPIMLRRQKEDVLTDFPAKTVEHIKFDISRAERQAYNGIRELIWDELQKMKELDKSTLAILPVKMLRLKQATGDLRLVDEEAGNKVPSTKLQTLKDMLEPIIKSGEKAIVFTQFAQMAKILQHELALAGHISRLIYGDIDAKERQIYVNEFRDNHTIKIMIMTEAGAYGLNLQAASYVFHYDAPWSVAKIEQREGRAHRVGQDKPVTVYHLIAKNTIDEYVLRVLAGKQKMSDQILGDEDQVIAKEKQLSLRAINEILQPQLLQISVGVKIRSGVSRVNKCAARGAITTATQGCLRISPQH